MSLVPGQHLQHFVDLPDSEAEAVEVEIVGVLALDEVHHVAHQGPGLEGLEHLRLREQRHVPLAEGRHKAVRLRKVGEVGVRAALALMQEREELRDLFDHRRHGVAGLLRLVKKLVDLQLLDEVRIVGLDEDRSLAAGVVEDILALDVLELPAKGLEVGVGRGGLLLETVDLVPHLRVLGHEVGGPVRHLLDFRLERALLFLLTIDSASEVRILRLRGTDLVAVLCDLLFGPLLRLLGGSDCLLDLLVLLLEYDSLLLRLLPLLLRQDLGITLHRDLCLQVLSLPFQRKHLFVLDPVLGLELLQFHLVQAQGVH
mmetsp:Transcript_39470/g.114256  ORF Transcript_39470/g.114256 Transcript_39470/m.114256 type:complete len:314 (-) Transcript_39470:985-1926(-)